MNANTLYYGRISNLFFYTLEWIGVVVGVFLYPSAVSLLCLTLFTLLSGGMFYLTFRYKPTGRFYPDAMSVVSVFLAFFIGYTYQSVILILMALMVNGTLLFIYRSRPLCRNYAVCSSLLFVILGIFRFPFMADSIALQKVIISGISLVLVQWVLYNIAKLLDVADHRTVEQERSLDDLLKIVEAKRIEAQSYSMQLEEYRAHLEERVQQQTKEIRRQSQQMFEMQQNAVEGMATLIESRDGSTGEHVRNTRVYVSMLVQYLYDHHLHPETVTREFVNNMALAAPLHDVGKIEISDLILNKPGGFTPEEFEIMKEHTVKGDLVVRRVLGEHSDPQLLQVATDVAHFHHEKFNGTGYPEGRSGEQIPLSARIMAVADVFDALVSKRVYKDAMTVDRAYQILSEGAGKHFDPELVSVFQELRPLVEDYVCSDVNP